MCASVSKSSTIRGVPSLCTFTSERSKSALASKYFYGVMIRSMIIGLSEALITFADYNPKYSSIMSSSFSRTIPKSRCPISGQSSSGFPWQYANRSRLFRTKLATLTTKSCSHGWTSFKFYKRKTARRKNSGLRACGSWNTYITN